MHSIPPDIPEINDFCHLSEPLTLLLTGGTGFLGSNLLHRLVLDNFRIVLLVRSTSNLLRIQDILHRIVLVNADETPLENIFLNERFDTIVHCATNYGRKEIDPMSILDANLMLPLKLMHLGKRHGVSCFINTDTILDKGVNSYSLSKCQFKEWLNVYSSDMVCLNVALEHFYGPLDDETKFVTFIIRSFLGNVAKIDLTKGEQKRDFIYVDDVIDAFYTIIRNSKAMNKGFTTYEIGTSRTIPIHEFVMMVKRLAQNENTHLNFGALPYRYNEVMESHVDTTEIERLGWRPQVSLEEGLRKTIELEKERIIL